MVHEASSIEFVEEVPLRGSGVRGVHVDPRAQAIVEKLKTRPGKTARVAHDVENATTFVQHLRALGAVCETRASSKSQVKRADGSGTRYVYKHDVYATYPTDEQAAASASASA